MPPKDIAFVEVSVVPAPRCESCMFPMEPYDSTRWACRTLDCIENGKPIHTGVYPMRTVEKGKAFHGVSATLKKDKTPDDERSCKGCHSELCPKPGLDLPACNGFISYERWLEEEGWD
jgi:hypothetical protein